MIGMKYHDRGVYAVKAKNMPDMDMDNMNSITITRIFLKFMSMVMAEYGSRYSKHTVYIRHHYHHFVRAI